VRANPFEIALLATHAMERLGIPYVVVGSTASSLHGEPRATIDVDFTVRMRASEVEPLCRALEKDFHLDRNSFLDGVRTGFPCNAIHRVHHVKLDLYIRRDEGIFAEELRRARRLRLTKEPGSEANVASAEDTVLQKLLWFRKGGEVSDRQWRDVLGVLKAQSGRLERDYMHAWGDELGVLDLLQRALVEVGQAPLGPERAQP
jgi:hypothetical protein